jgi:hypothetical protein
LQALVSGIYTTLSRVPDVLLLSNDRDQED